MAIIGASLRRFASILVDSGNTWLNERAHRLGAGLAYYSLFALVPVLVLAISLASLFFGSEAALGEVESTIEELLGADIAGLINAAIDQVLVDRQSALVPLLSLGVLLFTATLLFVAWRDVVNLLWHIPRQTGMRASLDRRLFGLAAVLGSGLLLTLVLFAETFVGLLGRFVESAILDSLLRVTSSLVPATLGAVFLGVLFRYTPDRQVAWKAVWPASILTMGLLSVGAWGYGVYLDVYGFGSAAGVAGSLLLGLAFVYYSAQILLYGVVVVRTSQERLDLEALAADE